MRQFWLILLLLLSTIGRSQHYNFITYAVKDGLAQSQVRDICQDAYGYLWLATVSGLSRFDGKHFTNFSVDDGLSDNNISNVYYGLEDKLWVCSSTGLSAFDQHQFNTWAFPESYRINEITQLKGDLIMASNTGLIQKSGESFVQLGDSLEQEIYFRTAVNYKDSILLCGSKNGVYSWNGSSFQYLDLGGYENLSIRKLKIIDDVLYITARRVGLITHNLQTAESAVISLRTTSAKAIEPYRDGFIGITTNGEAFIVTTRDTLYIDESNGLKGSGLNCIFKDGEGNIWIGTDGKGVWKFAGTSVVSYAQEDGLASELVLSIAQDAKGNFVFGTYNAGITVFEESSKIDYSSGNSNIVDNTVWAIRKDNEGRLWLGTSRGLTVMNPDGTLEKAPYEIGNPKVRTLEWANQNTLLLGGDMGLMVCTKDSIYTIDSLNINKLIKLGDKVYCGASNGLFVFDRKGDFTEYEQIELPENKVFTLTSDFKNNLWIGTENGLFVRFPTGNIMRMVLQQGVYRSKNIQGLITTSDSSIWVSSMKGVFQVNYAPDSPLEYEIRAYGLAEGIIDEESNVNAIFEDDQANIWVGTAAGVVRIDPSQNEELFNYKQPLTHITGLRLFMEAFDYEDYNPELDDIFHIPKKIELPHYENHLTFDFIGINLKDPEAVKYEYRLIGVSDQWSPISNSNYATYSFLQPGDYTFEVRSMNKNNDWSKVEEMIVIIRPPFWRTWWFIALISLSVSAIVYYFLNARIRVIRQKNENEKLDLKNRLLFLEQRSLNASMNRHFIFNSLNSIQYFINSSDKLSANRFLTNFAKLIRKNLDSSAANNFIVTLSEEIERIELYLSLERMRFSNKFDYLVDVASDLDTEELEIPSMILQPFVENSIIHGVLPLNESRKGKIEVKIYREFGELVFEVTDNGLGIDNSLEGKSASIEGDHESKGVDITNRRIDILRKLTGENLLIVGPFQMEDSDGNALGTKVILKLGDVEKE